MIFKKNALISINRNMSNKSLFEKLFEDVMENDALGLPPEGGEEGGIGGEEGGHSEGEDTVTLTLDRATAEKLVEALQDVLGGGEEEGEGESEGGEGGDELAFGDEASEDEETEDSEDEETEDSEDSLKESPQSEYKPFNVDPKKFTSKSANKVGGVAGTATAHGKAQQTSQTKGTETYMPMNTSYDDGKSMKAKGTRTSSPSGPGKSLFN